MEGMLVEGNHGMLAVSPAVILESDHDVAWAEKYVEKNPALSWILAKYVEADRANNNTQMWTLGDLREYRSSVNHGPLNILHQPRNVVGTIVANELIYPKTDEAGVQPTAYVETLAAFWRYYRQEEYELIRKAYDSGALFISMECVAESLTCTGELGCEETFDYAGVDSDSYCSHLQERKSVRRMNKPHFLGGGLILPPARPGWSHADVTHVSELVKSYEAQAEEVYTEIAVQTPHLEPQQWEQMMQQVLSLARDVPMAERKKLAEKNATFKGTSYPTKTMQDLKNAIQAFGRAKPEDRAALKRYLLRRARALGAPEEMIEHIKELGS